MSAFALGTLPALLSFSWISSLAKSAFQRRFLCFAGASLILLGLMNIQHGLVLTGSGMNSVASAECPSCEQRRVVSGPAAADVARGTHLAPSAMRWIAQGP